MPYGIQQPAISGQILQLEKNLGAKLFHRRPFGLTPSGGKLFSEIEPFFAGLADLPDQIRGDARQRLRLAAPATILKDYLPKIFAKYKKRYRDFSLTLHDANQASAEALLSSREVDLAITELEGKPARPLRSCILARFPLCVVVRKETRFRTMNDFFRMNVPLPDLISLPRDEVLSKLFHAELKKQGFSWSAKIELSSLELIDLYTSLDFGVGLSLTVPRSPVRKELRVVPLKKFPPLAIAALWNGDLSGPASAFLADIQHVARSMKHK